MDIPDRKISQSEFDDLKSPIANDLIAYFGLLEKDMENLFEKAVEENWTIDELILKIDELIDGNKKAEPRNISNFV